MATLYFNNNYLWILFPAADEGVMPIEIGHTWFLRCYATWWPVRNLQQESGIDDYPGEAAAYLVQCLAVSVPNVNHRSGILVPDEHGWYWTQLYSDPSAPEGISVLCSADSDHGLYGVGSEEEQAEPLFLQGSADAKVWVPVAVTSIDAEEISAGRIFARIQPQGEAIAGWTKTAVSLIQAEHPDG